jgi:hypothetical protein
MMVQFNPPRDKHKGQLKDMIEHLLCDVRVFSVDRALLMGARKKGIM